ncbi:MAG: TetR family transcriptional regulator [Alphaproteobacteria bacterium]
MAGKAVNNKQKPQKPVNIREEAARAALVQAAAGGWDHVGIAELAAALGLSADELLDHIRDKTDILAAIGHMIDRETLKEAGSLEGESVRDRLFDLMMQRFEQMNAYRDGLVSIMQSFKYDPVQALIHAPYLCRSMHTVLEAAGENPSGAAGALKIAGLTGVFLQTLRVWAEDETPDLSRTMAALDRDLARVEKAAGFLRF